VPIPSPLVACRVTAPIRCPPAASQVLEILPAWACLAMVPIRFRRAVSRAAAIPARRVAFPATGPILAAWVVSPPVRAPILFRWAASPVAPAALAAQSVPVAAAPAGRA
jgi:hypothetical protein